MNTQYKISSTALELVLLAPKNNRGASFTVRSKESGKDYTYMIQRAEFKGNWYTHIFVEKTYLHFDYIGNYFNGNIWLKKQQVKTPRISIVLLLKTKVVLKENTMNLEMSTLLLARKKKHLEKKIKNSLFNLKL